jgi:hypothetical protein
MNDDKNGKGIPPFLAESFFQYTRKGYVGKEKYAYVTHYSHNGNILLFFHYSWGVL